MARAGSQAETPTKIASLIDVEVETESPTVTNHPVEEEDIDLAPLIRCRRSETSTAMPSSSLPPVPESSPHPEEEDSGYVAELGDPTAVLEKLDPLIDDLMIPVDSAKRSERPPTIVEPTISTRVLMSAPSHPPETINVDQPSSDPLPTRVDSSWVGELAGRARHRAKPSRAWHIWCMCTLAYVRHITSVA